MATKKNEKELPGIQTEDRAVRLMRKILLEGEGKRKDYLDSLGQEDQQRLRYLGE